MSRLLEEMNWKELEKALRETKTVIVPCGSTEEHGYHLPLSTDTLIACEIARRTAERVNVLVAPPINYGVCRSTGSFPGTLTISLDALRALVEEICESLHAHGFRNIILLPGHLGAAQMVGLELAAQKLVEKHQDLSMAVVRWEEAIKKLTGTVLKDPRDGHAGEAETSLMLALKPELVRMEKTVDEHPRFPEHLVVAKPGDYLKSGVMGSPTKASREKGEKILEALVREVEELVKRMEKRRQHRK
ncbi:creatininase family protein [Candidatus Hecatella orcuttiae]|jgi:creatinine amidohydrolase|uniref:creatininase family protein n=1 Tax=Candidatus Hecatella orcuttiae TaxID=1935119 RepID=UPI0028682673|nr:creatininase family protein [Candidatus Hecatella orcuttiae]